MYKKQTRILRNYINHWRTLLVAGLRYYFRIYKYEYLGELMTSELHIPVITGKILVLMLSEICIPIPILGGLGIPNPLDNSYIGVPRPYFHYETSG